MGYVIKDYPSRRAFIATNDEEYVSASDVQNDLVPAAIDPMTAAAGYKSFLVQHMSSTQLEHDPKNVQYHNLFNMFLIIKDRRVRII
jgi:hypothetical protein